MEHSRSALVFLLICFIAMAACKPVHHLQKRTTVEDTLGDLTTNEAGAINCDGELLEMNKHACMVNDLCS